MSKVRRILPQALVVVTCLACLQACSGTADDGVDATTASQSDPTTGDATPAATTEAVPPAEAIPEAGTGPPVGTNLQPSQAAGAVVGVPAKTNTAPIVAVANYYTDLPGFDLTALGERARERFLHRVNSEMCTCGCKNDTLARCHVNDPTCPVVKGMVQRIYDEVRSGS